jgi:hypothetical protein
MNRRTYGNRLDALEQRAAQQQTELAERVGNLMADLLHGVLNDLQLTPEQWETASESVPRHLRMVGESLTGGTP